MALLDFKFFPGIDKQNTELLALNNVGLIVTM